MSILAKNKKKIQKALEARKSAVPNLSASEQSKFKFHVPGSQNRKKGY